MTKAYKKTRDMAMAMTLKERARLWEELFATFHDQHGGNGKHGYDDQMPYFDQESIVEFERRDEEIRTGKVKTIPAEQVFRECRARLRK